MEAAGDEDRDPFEWEVRDSSTPFVHHAFAGSCAGVAEHLCMYPVDTVKTRVQASWQNLGVRAAVREVFHERGLAGFMRGAAVIGIGCIPAHVGLFGTYELARSRWVDADRLQHQPLRTAACGAAAAVVHDAILTPHDVVKQRLQLGRHAGALDCIASTWRQGGFRAFYRSLPATLAMNVPYTGTLVATNESLKLLLELRRDGADARLSDASWYFLCAGASGAVAAALTSPFDVVRTRLQTTETIPTGRPVPLSGAPSLRPDGMLSTLRAVLRSEGPAGLFRGLGPRVLLAAPSAAVSWGTYETVRMALKGLEVREASARHSAPVPRAVPEGFAMTCRALVQPASI